MKKMTVAAMFIAIGVLSAHLIYIPVVVAKCFPIQSAINILLAVVLGMRWTVSAAFGISLLRNILGTGSLLAFPGSMIGAALAAFLYKKTQSIYGAILGEVIGTGIIGAFIAYPVAQYLLASNVGAWFFVLPFMLSALGGGVIAYLTYQTPLRRVFNEFVK